MYRKQAPPDILHEAALAENIASKTALPMRAQKRRVEYTQVIEAKKFTSDGICQMNGIKAFCR